MTNATTITAQPGTPIVDVVREFDAPPALVFRAQTDPELLVKWLGPREIEMELIEYDPTPGGRYQYIHRDPEGGEHSFHGVFHAVVRDQLVIQTFEYERVPNQVSLETMTLTDLGGRTRLHTHSVFPSVEARDAMVASGMERGVRDSMDRLEEVVQAGGKPGEAQVVVDITMSLDGYVTAPGAGPEHGLGIGGEPLHEWVWKDKAVLDAAVTRTGAVIMGRNTFDVIDAPGGWSDEIAYGADRRPQELPPFFVVTHSQPASVRFPARFQFVADLKEAVEQARAAAGDKDVVIMGGGAICHSALAAGLVDTVVLHVAPLVLGDGTPLFPDGPSASFRLERLSTNSTPEAEHITYRVLN